MIAWLFKDAGQGLARRHELLPRAYGETLNEDLPRIWSAHAISL